MIVLICGGRDCPWDASDEAYLLHLHQIYTFDLVMTGGIGLVKDRQGQCRGVDGWAALWAIREGLPTVIMSANWRKQGRSAGPRRNRRMLTRLQQEAQAHATRGTVLAWPGGRGTQNMVQQAKRAGIAVWTIYSRDDAPF